MNRIKLIVLLQILLAGTFTSFVQSDFKEVKNPSVILDQLKLVSNQTHSISANYTEEKQLAAFKKPQFAKGKFYYLEKDKMRWEQTTPFDYLIIINGKQLSIRDNGVVKNMGQGNRALSRVNEFLLSLIQGNYQDNSKLGLRCLESSTLYQIELTPKNSSLSRVYAKLKLYFSKSDKRLRYIEFFEAGGDTKTMRFTDQTYNGSVNKTLFTI